MATEKMMSANAMINFDKTYCSSPKCQNKCGRKLPMPEVLKKRFDDLDPGWDVRIRIWYSDFCDENGEVIKHD